MMSTSNALSPSAVPVMNADAPAVNMNMHNSRLAVAVGAPGSPRATTTTSPRASAFRLSSHSRSSQGLARSRSSNISGLIQRQGSCVVRHSVKNKVLRNWGTGILRLGSYISTGLGFGGYEIDSGSGSPTSAGSAGSGMSASMGVSPPSALSTGNGKNSGV